MPILGFDIDGVLYPWQIACFEHLSLFYGYTGTYEDLWDHADFSKFVSNRGPLFVENLLRIQHLYSCFPPTLRDYKSLKNLAKKYEIVYITSRPKDVEWTTLAFFKRYDYPNYDNIIFSDDKVLDVRLYGCDYFVEDRPVYCFLLQNVTNLIMRTQPWNLSIRGEIKNQIQNLQDLERMLL